MNFIIFGDAPNWSRALNLLTSYRPDIQISGLSSPNLGKYKDADVTFSLREVKELYDGGRIDGVIQIQGENCSLLPALYCALFQRLFSRKFPGGGGD